MNDKWMEDFSKAGLFNLTRRHLTLIHLLWDYARRESKRIALLEVPTDNKSWFIKIPTIATFFSKRGDGKIISLFNEFIQENLSFDSLLGEANQLNRVVIDLQKAGILFNPKNPIYAEVMGTKQALILTKAGEGVEARLNGKHSMPIDWPDALPFDPISGRALWDYAVYSKPIAIGEKK